MPHDPEKRQSRWDVIRQVIAGKRITNQAALMAELASRGILVGQSSLSRDLRGLGARKKDGAYQLAPAGAVAGAASTGAAPAGAAAALAGAIRGLAPAGPNLLVVRTDIGSAPRVGVALDAAGFDEVVGTVAGDDTIFVATAGAVEQAKLVRRLEALAKGGNHG